MLRQNRRFSSPHPFGRAGLARFEPRRLVSTSERRLPGENVCYLRNLGTDEPLTSMNGMARGRATSSLSQNRQNREPTRTGSRSGSCTDPRHRPAEAFSKANAPLIEAQAGIPFAQALGGGLVAAIDGMRFVVPVPSVYARPNRKYFGPKRGVTWLNMINDQAAGLGAKVVQGTIRDSLHMIDVWFSQDGG
ncbi:MAG TPA: Tn3 family transposase, partial [Streptosporangiaceae bacterium]|nr:Tn3 family transposase [Streptosporangiaceae bacterium]